MNHEVENQIRNNINWTDLPYNIRKVKKKKNFIIFY